MSIHRKPIFLQTAIVALLLASAQAGAEGTQANTGWPITSSSAPRARRRFYSCAVCSGVAM